MYLYLVDEFIKTIKSIFKIDNLFLKFYSSNIISNFEIFKLFNFQNLKIIKMEEIIEKRNKDIYMNQISKIYIKIF